MYVIDYYNFYVQGNKAINKSSLVLKKSNPAEPDMPEWKNLPASLLGKLPSIKVLFEVARKTMCEPEWLGYGLGMEACDIFNCISIDTPTRQFKKVEILQLWIRQKGKDATYRSLLECIWEDSQNRQLVEAIISMMKNENDGEVGDRSSTASITAETMLEKRLAELENKVELLLKAPSGFEAEKRMTTFGHQ